ncbi:F0F1 ATP synthase subunit delta [Azospirillum sp.]|uniref:F0F1 ATP synthase subunit B family protein n=1 Tax=Azospirillum sp. TaxID=34012 RepID=UPI003D75B2BA
MHVDGWTLLLQAVNFLILVWLLRHFLYRPVLAVIAERQAATERVRTQAEAIRQEADGMRRGLEDARAGLSAERDRLLAAARAEAEAERTALIDKARADADRLLADARARLEEERRQALAGLRGQAAALGADLAGRLLLAAGGDDGRFLDAACRSVEGLPEAQRHALAGEETPAPVRLVTAAPLDPAPWRTRLAAALGRPVALSLAEDPGLIAGVELHFPHSVLRHSWKQALAEATEELTRDDDAHASA